MKRLAFHTVHAAFGVGLAALAGCGRSPLYPGAADGGLPGSGPEVHADLVRDVGAWHDVDTWRADLPADSASERGREAGPEAGPELGREAGAEAHREAGPDAGPEVGREVGPEVSPTGPACVPALPEPRRLLTLEERPLYASLAVYGDRVFTGIEVDEPSGAPKGGEVVGVSMSTGAKTTFPVGSNIAIHLLAQRDAIFYCQGKIVQASPTSWAFDYPNVATLDLQTGKVSELDNPPGFSSPSIQSLVGNSKGEIFWAINDGGGGSAGLVRWEPTTRTAMTIQQRSGFTVLLADDESLYWAEADDSDHLLFLSMPMVGGEVSQLYQSPAPIPDAPTLHAVDDQRIYYSTFNDAAAGIMAMPKGGGQGGVTVVPNVRSGVWLGHAIDDTHVYWVNYSEQHTLHRTLKTDGGHTETVWSAPGRLVMDVLVDACNVYWVVANPYEILVRSK